ncbi:hypothetical protein ACWF0M_30975 [Kribbella sp. NPDC055110]
MTGASVALLAGTMSTILANIGNAVHCIYVVHLPPGPIWFLHGFYVVTSALMLLWWLRFHASSRHVGRPVREVVT